VLQAAPVAPRKRTTGEEQWFLAKETRKAAKRLLEETAATPSRLAGAWPPCASPSLAVQKLAVQRHALVKRPDRQHASADAAHKHAKRHLNHAVAAMRSLSEVICDAED